jgi:cobalt-zinc-cadmium efflux system membrane fusion protein
MTKSSNMDPNPDSAAIDMQARKPRRAAIAIAIVAIGLIAGGAYELWRRFGNPSAVAANATAESERADGKTDSPSESSPQAVRLSDESIRKYGIRIGAARKQKLSSEIIAPARVAFDGEAMAVIGAPVQGRVAEIHVVAGDRVDKGAALLEIESTELGEAQSDYLQRKAALATARNAIGPITEIHARVKKLFDEKQLVPFTEVQERELALRNAEGALATATAAAAAANNKLHLFGMTDETVELLERTGKVNSRYVVRSPLVGEVIDRTVNRGELVKPEREKLLVIADTSKLWVWADVPEVRAGEVARGCPAEITVNAAGNPTFKGVVCYLSPSIDDPTRSLRLRIEVKSDPALRPGMFAQATIKGKAAAAEEPVLAIPESAIQTVGGHPAVFLPAKDQPNSFELRSVAVGSYVGGMVTVTSGIQDGERVVTAGSAILKAELLKATAKDED